MGEAAGRSARHELRAAYSAMVRPVGSEARPAMPVEAFAGLAPPAVRSASATACRARQAWRLLAQLARRAMGEAAGRLATHELRAACSPTVCLEHSEPRPAMLAGAFVGLAPPAFHSAPATACCSRQAKPGRLATGLTAMLPADLVAPRARVGRGLFPEDSVGDLRSLSPSLPRTDAGQ